MHILERNLRVTMPDGSKWDVPIRLIANNRAKHYKDEFGGSLLRSLSEDTLPLFEKDHYEIKDWAANEMNWSDVRRHATKVDMRPADVDYEDGWCNGEKEIV